MIRSCKAFFVIGAACLLAGAAPAQTAPTALPGTLWQTADGKFVVEILTCGEAELCGKLVWLREPIDSRTGEEKLDYKNPDDSLRSRPICGIRIVEGLEPRGNDRWEGGRLYNPDDGSAYSAALSLDVDEDRMALRAYVAFKALGKTVYLYRLDQPVDTCA